MFLYRSYSARWSIGPPNINLESMCKASKHIIKHSKLTHLCAPAPGWLWWLVRSPVSTSGPRTKNIVTQVIQCVLIISPHRLTVMGGKEPRLHIWPLTQIHIIYILDTLYSDTSDHNVFLSSHLTGWPWWVVKSPAARCAATEVERWDKKVFVSMFAFVSIFVMRSGHRNKNYS